MDGNGQLSFDEVVAHLLSKKVDYYMSEKGVKVRTDLKKEVAPKTELEMVQANIDKTKKELEVLRKELAVLEKK